MQQESRGGGGRSVDGGAATVFDHRQWQRSDEGGSMAELVVAHGRRKMYREVTLSLRSGLRDATAEFSFLRVRGLRKLLKLLHSVASDESLIPLFCHSQSIPELQVVPVLFQNTLKHPKDKPEVTLDHIFGAEPIKLISPATDGETSLAMRVLEGCCLINRESRDLALQYDGVKVLLGILSSLGALEQGACLDSLLSLIVDSSANQRQFEASGGLEGIVKRMKDVETEESTRLKCAEFLLLMLGQVYGEVDPPSATEQRNLSQLVGPNCASLMWAASQFGSTLVPEQRQVALVIQARRVLEALET
ncbi:binding protein [Wolffia australiana]